MEKIVVKGGKKLSGEVNISAEEFSFAYNCSNNSFEREY